jgi:hypothetical protein
MEFDLASVLKQFTGGAADAKAAEQHFEQAAQNARPQSLSEGLAAMFKSAQTPPLGQMVSQLFAGATADQQAAMLNQILASMSPTVLSKLLEDQGPLRDVLGDTTHTDGAPVMVNAAQAKQLTPEQVEQMTTHAEQHGPGVIDQLSSFYAQHTGLVKTLGGAALAIALAKMSQAQKK